MRAVPNAITSTCMLVVALALAGCGADGSPSGEATSNLGQAIVLQSPAVAGGPHPTIPRNYTCDGHDVSLPLVWGELPTGTSELALLILSLTPTHTIGSNVYERVSVAWAVTGLAPTLRVLSPGRLPRGAILGRDAQGSTRYSICPPRGAEHKYLFTLFASPSRLAAEPGFSDQTMFNRLSRAQIPFGQLLVGYTRA